jgi:DNA modification methylase
MKYNSIICGDCLDILPQIEENTIDLIITSPPYNIKKEYDLYIDDLPWDEYYLWCEQWLSECLRVLKPDGRMALNHYLSFGNKKGRTAPIMELNSIAQKLGFKHHSLAVWTDSTLSRRTAWGCYDDKTYVMTKRGFKLFKDVDIKDDLFATIDQQGKLEWQKATDYIKNSYKGNLLNINNKDISLQITFDHNLAFYDGEEIKLQSYNKIPKGAQIPKKHKGLKKEGQERLFFFLPRTKGLCDLNINMDSWLFFLGVFIINGKISGDKITFYKNNTVYSNILKKMLYCLPFNISTDETENKLQIKDKQLASYLEKHLREIPEDILDLSIRQKKLFLEGLFFGELQNSQKDEKYIEISHKKLYEKITLLLMELNYTFYTEIIKGKKGRDDDIQDNSENCYRISITEALSVDISDTEIYENYYDGDIYCVSVPNKTLFISRNGISCWCGNSWLKASAPYISSPFEGILFLYKDQWKKMTKGISDCPREDFIQLTGGIWKIKTEIRGLTPANFNIDLPLKCIRLLSYVDSIVLDPFSGSGTTPAACLISGRKYIGIELSENYCNIARDRCDKISKQNGK